MPHAQLVFSAFLLPHPLKTITSNGLPPRSMRSARISQILAGTPSKTSLAASTDTESKACFGPTALRRLAAVTYSYSLHGADERLTPMAFAERLRGIRSGRCEVSDSVALWVCPGAGASGPKHASKGWLLLPIGGRQACASGEAPAQVGSMRCWRSRAGLAARAQPQRLRSARIRLRADAEMHLHVGVPSDHFRGVS